MGDIMLVVLQVDVPRRNFLVKDLRSSKYRMRVAKSKKIYDRAAQKSRSLKERYAE